MSLVVGMEIIIPSPEKTFFRMVSLFASPSFYPMVTATVARGTAGFLISSILGLVIGVAAGKNELFYSFIRPILSIIRTTPVMSIILIALIWFNTEIVPVFVALLIGFPIICGNVIEGIYRVDSRLVEMASVFKVTRKRVLLHLLLPSVFPFFLAGASTALGLTWKVVISAEVLSRPVRALGTGLYEAKIQLETAEVFAWTVVAIFLSVGSDLFFTLIIGRIPWIKSRIGA